MWSLKQGNLFVVIILILLSLPSIFSLFAPGFFLSDDGEWMIIRFSAFHQALADGEFPVRWLGRLNHEYGYPVANFLYPAFMYIAEPIHLLGFGFVDTIKILFGLSMLGSLVFSYLWLSKLFTKWAAFVGALFYLYAPYHLFDLYKRGSVGEVLVLAVLPFILWMIEQKNLFFTSLAIALLILSHNTLAALFLPVVITYIFIRKISNIKYQILSIILGLSLSAFFWIPALFDLQYTKFFQTQVSNWPDQFANLQLVGLNSILVFILSGYILCHKYKEAKEYAVHLFFFAVGFLAMVLSLALSFSLWEILPVAFIQFPFRFLSLTIVSVAFLSSFIMQQWRGNLKKGIPIFLLIILGFSAMPYIKPARFFDKGDPYYATNEDSTNVQNEYMPAWVKVLPRQRPAKKVEIVEGVGEVDNVGVKNNLITFTVDIPDSAIARINTIYFPGWEAFVDGKKVVIDYNNGGGVMDLIVPKGEHVVAFRFVETPVRLMSDGISLIGLIGLLGLMKFRRNL